jgi:hypothetical protein
MQAISPQQATKSSLRGFPIRRVRAAPMSLQIANRGARVNNFGARWSSYGFRCGFGIANFLQSSASGRGHSSQERVARECSQPLGARVLRGIVYGTAYRQTSRYQDSVQVLHGGLYDSRWGVACASLSPSVRFTPSSNGNFGKQITLPSEAFQKTTT